MKKAQVRRARLKRFGLTVATFDAMMLAQGGVCAVCHAEPNGRQLDVDHCHAGGHVRALLCNRCNKLLGTVGDNPLLLEALAAYLRKHAP